MSKLVTLSSPTVRLFLAPPGPVSEFYGFGIGPEGFMGFEDGLAAEREIVPRLIGHGSFADQGRLGDRVVTLGGFARAQSPEQLWTLGNTLRQVGAETPVRATVEAWGPTRTAVGYRQGKVEFAQRRGGSIADWMLQLWFPDGLLYGETRQAGPASTIQLQNYGNHPATPRLQVTGSSGNGYRITGGGQTLTITRPLEAGVPHEFDPATRLLRVGGAVVLGGVQGGAVARVPAAGTRSYSVSVGQLTGTVEDTYE